MSGSAAPASVTQSSTLSGAEIPSLRSNSFHFREVRDVMRGPSEPCPVRGSEERCSPTRSLFLRIRDRMRLYTTDTTDFDDAEIRAIRERDGQLYADVSTKAALDDFAVDLRKLVPLEECASCPKRPECGGAFRGDPENVFERDKADVDRILRGLRGSIVDVGCGEGPYLDALRESVRAGIADYRGVDPDGARIALLRGRNPWAAYREGTLEDEGPERPASHVLFLRSYNHLSDPLRTIALAVSRLAVGGTLLVVDNVAFGLLRRGAQAARAERGPARFEHYRNASAADAAAVIERSCLRLRERRDVTPASSNEWLLHYEKTGTAG